MKSFLIIAVTLSVFALSISAASTDESKLSYDAGIMQELSGDLTLARASFEKAAAVKGDYSDAARAQLSRIYARDGKTTLQTIRGMLTQIKDQPVMENAYVVCVGALVESRRNQDAIDLGLFFSASFPESNLADDALYLIAKVYYEQKQIDATRVTLNQLLTLYPTSNLIMPARELLSASYRTYNETEDPYIACKLSPDNSCP